MKKVAIIGLGLMGGSLGLALKARRLAGAVTAYARREDTRQMAIALGAADATFDRPEDAVLGADVAVFCTPVLAIPELMRRCLVSFQKDCAVTDVGSTKGEVVAQAAQMFKDSQAVFVGSHPMAGSEKTGLEAADANLYEGAVVALTPGRDASAAAVRTLADMWHGVGARVVELDAAEHDRLVARTSHLPHLAAAALVSVVGRDAGARIRDFCGPGFRDTTRIASGSPDLWHDIVRSNQDALVAELRTYAATLGDLIALLEAKDFEGVRRFLDAAAAGRRSLLP